MQIGGWLKAGGFAFLRIAKMQRESQLLLFEFGLCTELVAVIVV
jgi:hypothetical protein